MLRRLSILLVCMCMLMVTLAPAAEARYVRGCGSEGASEYHYHYTTSNAGYTNWTGFHVDWNELWYQNWSYLYGYGWVYGNWKYDGWIWCGY